MADAKEVLVKLLASLGESAQFATSGCLSATLAGLEVRGIGSIRTPVSAADAKRLIAKATQAPYGRGEETIVDTGVRRVWQIEPGEFEIRNDAWPVFLASVVDSVKREFGVEQRVVPQLYKLLIYEKGSFFAPHRDTEKSAGMFATLIIGLPSHHTGGTLIVEHDGETAKIDFGGADSEFQMRYAAFFADCQHEVRPVLSGYRVCLVYNLAIAGKKRQPSAPKLALATQRTAELLPRLFTDEPDGPNKLAIPLEHRYTAAGLHPDRLKGADRTRAETLLRAAKTVGYQCFLALLTHHQSGEVDGDSWDYGYGYGSRRSRRWRDDDDEEERDESGAEMGEVYDEEIWLENWLDPAGKPQPFGRMQLRESEILTQAGKAKWEYRQEVHEATGNEGVSMDRWYSQAVLVIWPRDRYFRILADEGPTSALPTLEAMVARSKKPAALAECRAFANEIIDLWKPASGIGGDSTPRRMLALLEKIGTPDLLDRYLRKVLPDCFDGGDGESLTRLFDRFGWEPFAGRLRDFFDHQQPAYRLLPAVKLFESLSSGASASAERIAVCRSLAEPFSQMLERIDLQRPDSWDRRAMNRLGVVSGAVRIFSAIDAPLHLDRFVERILMDERHYGLHDVLIPEVILLGDATPGILGAPSAPSRIWQRCVDRLRMATAEPIVPPGDWARDAELGCRCEDCKALSRFLSDPSQQVARYAVRKERRDHLERNAGSHRFDVAYRTDTKGSPQTLVCTKTQASYERRKKQFEIDTALLAQLSAFAGGDRRVGIPTARRRPPKPLPD